jgi:hypothetical protein
MAITIHSEAAPLADSFALTQFLLPIPNGDQLGKLLEVGKRISTRAYDDETDTARFVESDGETVHCFTVTDITIDQAEMIAVECVGMQLGIEGFGESVARALGDSFSPDIETL